MASNTDGSGTRRGTGTDGSHQDTEGPTWDEIDHQLKEWGEQLDRLYTRARADLDKKQEQIIMQLETSYNAVRQDIYALKRRTEKDDGTSPLDDAKAQLSQLQETTAKKTREATEQIKESFDNLSSRVSSGEALDDIKDATERLKIGAVEVGEGLSRAWSELKWAFDSAGEKMKAPTDEKSDR